MKAIKANGAGNQFMLLDCLDYTASEGATLLQHLACPENVRRLHERAATVGGAWDQLVLLLSLSADPQASEHRIQQGSGLPEKTVRFWNSDGSICHACGNGSRVAGAYVMEIMKSAAASFFLPTANWRVLEAWRSEFPGMSRCASVSLGTVAFDWSEIPLAGPVSTLPIDLSSLLAGLEARLVTDGIKFETAGAATVGNPHVTLFTAEGSDAVSRQSAEYIAGHIQRLPLFPEGVNVGFVSVRSKTEVDLLVWERGSGYTLACGTGASAAAAIGWKLGLLANAVLLHLPGGPLHVKVGEDGTAVLTGPTTIEFTFPADVVQPLRSAFSVR